MDLNPMDALPQEDDAPSAASTEAAEKARLNSLVAITVAVLATFLAICNVKAGNIAQAMQGAQAEYIDQWNFYQARNIREEVGRAALKQLQVGAVAASAGPSRAAFDSTIAFYDHFVADQAMKKEGVQKDAIAAGKRYEELGLRDDQFDLAEALLAIAVSLLAMTALTAKRWLFWAAMVPTLLGLIMGLAGFVGWGLHPDFVTQMLS